MADSVCRRIVASVELSANDSAEIPDRDLHSTGSRSLGAARDIDGRPAECQSGRWVDTGGAEEHAKVADARVVVVWSMDGLAIHGRRDDVVLVVGEEDDIADDSDCTGYHCKRCSDAGFGGDPCDGDGDDGGESVWWNGEELCLPGAVAEGDDDCWLELVSKG